MASRSIKIRSSVVAVSYIENSMVLVECAVLNNCRVQCIGVICCIPTDQESSSKAELTWIQCISIVVEGGTVVIVEKAVDEEKLLTSRGCEATISIVPRDVQIGLLN